MHQYVNVERSEGEQAAHETLVLRQEVAALFQFLCSSEAHKQQLVQLNESHGIVLVKFVNMLASDLTQFFDLGIEKLQRIKKAQIDQDAQAWDALEPDMRKAKEDQLKEDESHCPGIVRMVGELMFLLKTMTRTIPEGAHFRNIPLSRNLAAVYALLISEIYVTRTSNLTSNLTQPFISPFVSASLYGTALAWQRRQTMIDSVCAVFVKDQVASQMVMMLNAMVERLCGKRATEVKVRNPEKYNFKPLQLLTTLVDTYCALHQDTPKNQTTGLSVFAHLVVQVGNTCILGV